MKKPQISTEEMKKTVADSLSKLRSIRFGASGAKSNNVKESRMIRREIARMKTNLGNK